MSPKPDGSQPAKKTTSKGGPARVIREMSNVQRGTIHPALIPGIGVDETGYKFKTNWWIFGVCFVFIVGFLAWGFAAPENFSGTGQDMQAWITRNLGWFLSSVAVVVFIFMAWIAFSKRGRIRLGADNEKPEYSTVSWIAMLFGAGMGATLVFYGTYEPLEYLVNVPPGFDVEPGSPDAALASMSQIMFHWGAIPWAIYGLIGGAMAYSTYRRGRPGLMSAIFDPLLNQRTKGFFGPVIDIFAIIVTIFGTATSLGVGAGQITRGMELIAGIPPAGNALLIGVIAVLTAMFITSAVSGVKRGIQWLSNANMVIAALLALFVFVAGPTFFLLNFMPSSVWAFFQYLPAMLTRSAMQGDEAAQFLQDWTVFYWAWWIAVIPYVGMFIAKISRGRTLREFFIGVVGGPTVVTFFWFALMGGTSMHQEMQGLGMSDYEQSQDILFNMLNNLPLGMITGVLAMISIILFFVTTADSSTLVMGSIAQGGRTAPTKWVTFVFGLAVSLFALVMLLAGGDTILSTVQAFVTIAGMPFAVIVVIMMIAWAKDLNSDPLLLRMRFAQEAIKEGVRRGIEDHGNDFTFAASEVDDPDQGAGAWLDTDDPTLGEWYNDATGSIDVVPDTDDAEPEEKR